MKTKAELIAKAMKAALKAANGEHMLLTIGGTAIGGTAIGGTVPPDKASKDQEVKAEPKRETWRERNLRRQAEGVKFECRPSEAADTDLWYLPREWRFDGNEEDYREYVPEPLPHTKLRVQYEKKLAAGEEVVVQVRNRGAWVDLDPKEKVSWLPDITYRIKPETKTIWFGLFRDRDNVYRFCADANQRSEKALIEKLAEEGFTPVGSIESREVGIES